MKRRQFITGALGLVLVGRAAKPVAHLTRWFKGGRVYRMSKDIATRGT